MICFIGRIQTDSRRVVSCNDGVKEWELPPRYDLRNHSPDGFSWGYRGSGPAQLALALMALTLNNDDRACRIYQRFKEVVIASIPQDMGWILSDFAVKTWEKAYRNGDPVKVQPWLLIQKRLAAYHSHG